MWREIMNPVEIASALFIFWSLPVNNCVVASKMRDFPLPGTHNLHSALHHFDVLHADHLIHRVTQQEKLVDGEHTRELEFQTLNRDFTLLLSPRRALFHQHFRVHVVESGHVRLHPPQFDQFYEGTVHGEKDSIIAAHIDHRSGIVTASIAVDSERYYIEPSHRHFNESHDFHMITYRASDLKYNLTRDPSRHFCGNPEHNTYTAAQNISGPNLESQVFEKEWKKLLGVEEGSRERLRRAVGGDACPLHLVATHQFSALYAPTNDMNDVVIFLLQIIDMIDRDIFRVTTWSGGLQNLGFLVTDVTVYLDSSDTPIYNQDREWNSGLLLQAFSHQDWSSVCLAHLFTAVDFTDGRLGVAYIASGDSQSTGGICSEFLNLQGQDTTANVGVSSYVLNQRQLLLAEAQLVTAHELGHNWGSEHDPTDAIGPCNPGSGGQFLMFPSASDATEDNNNVFSPCSAEMVGRVLQTKSTCFIDSTDQQCGNFEVEEGEDCDAGFLGVLGQDQCCNATCRRFNGSVMCSDVNDPCCDNCAIASNNTICRVFTQNNRQCLADILCNGNDKTCPNEPNFVAIDTPCGTGGRCVPPGTNCSNGPNDCVHGNSSSIMNTTCFSYCQLRNMEDCRCPDEVDCRFCCQATGGGECSPFDTLPDTSTCLGGFCERGECIPASQDLVQRLFSLFTDLDINAFWQLIRENIVGSVLFVTVLIWVPIATVIHCFDRYRWQRHKEIAMLYEEEAILADIEDDEDLLVFDDIATVDPKLLSPAGKIGLMRLGSRTESIHSDFFSAEDHYHPYELSPTSPVKSPGGISARRLSTIAEAEDSQQLDPERDNILTYMGTPRQSFDTNSINPLVGTDV